MTAPDGAGEQERMQQNKKAFEVVLADGTVKTILAQEVQETDLRIKFLGYVEGHNDGSYSNDAREVVESLLNADVKSYRLVPVPEKNAASVGKNLYRVNLKDGGHKDVQGDIVKHQSGTKERPGWYSISTNLRHSDSRTEYLVPEDLVADIERVTETGVPAQTTAKA